MRKKFIYCYNKYLLKFLLERGFKYLSIGTNKKSNTKYFLFERTGKLTGAMDEYESNKKITKS